MYTQFEKPLIQRGRFNNTEDAKGIDSIIGFEYMGSAEYEHGALYKSLQRIRNYLPLYSMEYIEYLNRDNELMAVFCKKDSLEDVKGKIEQLITDTVRCREYCGLKHYTQTIPSEVKGESNFWWDIENDFMICFGEEKANQVKVALGM
jgi:hypothetical protein